MADAGIHIVHVQSEGNNKVGLVFLKAVGKRSESNRFGIESQIFSKKKSDGILKKKIAMIFIHKKSRATMVLIITDNFKIIS